MDNYITEFNEQCSSSEEESDDDEWDDIGDKEDSPEIPELQVEQKIKHLEHFNSLIVLQMSSFALASRSSHYEPSFVWKIKIKRSKKDEAFRARSKAFNLTGYPEKVRATLEWKKDMDDAFVWLSFLKCKCRKRKGMAIIPQVFFLLRGQTGNDTKHKCSSTRNYFPDKSTYALKLFAELTHKSWLVAKEFNAEDSVTIEIYVEPPSMAQQVHSYDGTLNGAIDQFRTRKGMEEEGFLWLYDSPYFYTGPEGHRVQVRLTLKGDSFLNKRNLQAEICFLAGEFDRHLSGCFYHKTTVTLVNHKDPDRNITKSVFKDVKDEKHYWIDVCTATDLNNLIIDDTLYYEVNVKAHQYQCFQ